MTTASYPFSRTTVETLSALKAEPAWMRDLRLRAWDQVVQLSSPKILSTLQAFTEPSKTSAPMKEWPRDLQHALDERGDEEGLIVHRDSTVLSRAISKEQAAHGVR